MIRTLALTVPFLILMMPTQLRAQESAKPLEVSIPHFNNIACPIMGKPISTRQYTLTDYGRIYICCKSCIQDIQDDVETAYKASYPTTKKVGNKICPISGEKILENSPTILVQGHEIAISKAEHAAEVRANLQAVLTKLSDPEIEDLGNGTDPMTSEQVAPDTFVLIGKTMVRVESIKSLTAIKKDPAAALKKARAIRADELTKAKLAEEAEAAARAKKEGVPQ